MTKSAFDKIKVGLSEAKAYLDGSGNKRDYGIHVPARVNVKRIRTRLGLSQEPAGTQRAHLAQGCRKGAGGRNTGLGEDRLTIYRVRL